MPVWKKSMGRGIQEREGIVGVKKDIGNGSREQLKTKDSFFVTVMQLYLHTMSRSSKNKSYTIMVYISEDYNNI